MISSCLEYEAGALTCKGAPCPFSSLAGRRKSVRLLGLDEVGSGLEGVEFCVIDSILLWLKCGKDLVL